MEFPFSVDQFFAVFRSYNRALWPAPVVLSVLALVACALVRVRGPRSDQVISIILAALWAWLAVAYHLAFFAAINPLAYGFAALALLAAGLFLWHGVAGGRLRFGWPGAGRGFTGIALIGFALVVYPAWCWRSGHPYPELPTFGLPCPTTLFTIGLLAFLRRPYPLSPHIVPVIWCAVGSQAAFGLGVTPDLMLIPAGLVGVFLMVRRK